MTEGKARFAAVGMIISMMVGVPTLATAQQHPVNDCKPELIKATGAATIFGTGRARRLAINNWQREVRQKYGERYMDITHARQVTTECESASIGTIGQLNKRCTVNAHPCAPGTPVEIYQPQQGSVEPGDRVVCFAQRVLIRQHYLADDQFDCEYGPITRRAVVRFQRDHNLERSGELDQATLERLRRAAGGVS